MNLRVSGIGPIQRPEIRRLEIRRPEAGTAEPRESGTRQVCFDPDQGYVETPLLWRPDLGPGTVVDGPAIVEEFGSTVPLHPGFTARVDDFANLIVTKHSTGQATTTDGGAR